LTTTIVDASVAAKWVLEERHSPRASSLLGSEHDLAAPDLLALEVANVLIQRIKRNEITEDAATQMLVRVIGAIRRLWRSDALAPGAFELARQFDITPYDASYVALALRLECRLVTADRRLYDHLHQDLSETMVWIGDLPEADDPSTAES
jgi:predicted nucleic acid-binding protein